MRMGTVDAVTFSLAIYVSTRGNRIFFPSLLSNNLIYIKEYRILAISTRTAMDRLQLLFMSLLFVLRSTKLTVLIYVHVLIQHITHY
jgi:hypothetical protein